MVFAYMIDNGSTAREPHIFTICTANIRLWFHRCYRIKFIFALLLIIFCAPAASKERLKRVLIVSSYNITYPGVFNVTQGVMQRLEETSSAKLEILSEFVDRARFPENDQEHLIARYLAEKYASARPDVVVTVGRQASNFFLKYRDSIARNIPLVLCCAPAKLFTESLKLSNVTGVISARDITRTLNLAERLQPGASKLVVSAGASEFDREWMRIARQQIESRSRKFDTRYLVGVPYEKLIREVSNLRRDTILIALTHFADENGTTYVSPEVVKGIAKAASAPVYSPYPASFGYGIVGGYSDFNLGMGAQLADIALDILSGKSATAIIPQMSAAGEYRVDYRQLQRWKLSKYDLPAETVVSFEPASLWDEHAYLIMSVIAAFALTLGSSIYIASQASKRLRAERSLKDSEDRMVFAAASTNSGLMQIKAEDQPIWATEYCRMLVDLPNEASLTLDKLSAKVHPDDRAAFARNLRAAIRNGAAVDYEFRTVDREGEVRWIAAKGKSFRQKGQRSMIVDCVLTDVTALKVAEHNVETQRREVAHLMRQSLVNELSGSIAHELNQPLSAILSNAEAAQELLNRNQVDSGKIREILTDIIEENIRASDVIGRVRRLLKTGDSKIEPISIDKLVESTLALLQGEFVKRQIMIDVDCPPKLPLISGEFVQLQQVLINIIVNAMDAMTSVSPVEREVKIQTISNGDQLKVTISDKGHGISADIREQLFRPFVSTKEQGLGLGLSICATILKAHRGKIELENNKDCGATVIITLPAQNVLEPAQ
jgi:signal transduction histidine kinase/ABC-type uncharacterized transport system substrate-binding protein